MLSLKLQNRVDLLFAHAVRKDSFCVNNPGSVASVIFEQIQPDSGSLYYKDVEARVRNLATQFPCDSFDRGSDLSAPEKNKGGRPKKWHGRLRQIRVPDEFADALLEIALEWQLTSLESQDIPF